MYRIGVDFGGFNVVAVVIDDETNRIVGKSETQIKVAQSTDFIMKDLKDVITHAPDPAGNPCPPPSYP